MIRRCLLLVAAGCGADEAPCIEDRVTITQGLYGLVTYQTDVSPETNGPTPVAGEPVSVLDRDSLVSVAEVSSDASGVFQVSLDVGGYALCASECVGFVIHAGKLVRVDLHKGFGPSQWVGVSRSACAD